MLREPFLIPSSMNQHAETIKTESRNGLPVLIAGGGIGGLAAAIALARHGYHSLILERVADLHEVGAGIQLAPNAFNAFDYLGIGSDARKVAVFIDSLRLIDAVSGESVVSIPLTETFRRRYGNPYAVMHRGELYSVLLRAARSNERIHIRTKANVSDFILNDTSVTAILGDGEEQVQGAALIGADGLWSNIRERIVGDGPPRVSGHSTYRSVLAREEMPEELQINAATLWAGPKCHIVHYPLSDWKLFNLVVTYHNDAPQPVAGMSVEADEVRRGFESVTPKIKKLIDQCKDWKLWVLCDREPTANWSSGRVTLLGDAAHAMLQYFAQGACMALEDAVCLADAVRLADGDFEAAFQRYQSERILRTARVQIQSRAIGDYIYHPAGVVAELRNSEMRSRSDEDWYHSLDWLYGHNASLHASDNRARADENQETNALRTSAMEADL